MIGTRTIFDEPRGEAATEFVRLQQEIARREKHERDVQQRRQTLQEERERLDAELVDAYAGNGKSESRAAKLKAELERVRGEAGEDWSIRAQAAQRRTREAEAELQRFVGERLGDLLPELVEDALAAQRQLEERLRAVPQAIAALNEIQARMGALLQAADLRTQGEFPHLGLDVLGGEIARTLERGIPSPIPRSLQETSDPTIKTPA